MTRCIWLMAAAYLLLSGRSSPAPGSPAAIAQASGEKCNVCIVENPGVGNTTCLAICQQHEIDQAAYQKSIGR
jgi:hypothetical protein